MTTEPWRDEDYIWANGIPFWYSNDGNGHCVVYLHGGMKMALTAFMRLKTNYMTEIRAEGLRDGKMALAAFMRLKIERRLDWSGRVTYNMNRKRK